MASQAPPHSLGGGTAAPASVSWELHIVQKDMRKFLCWISTFLSSNKLRLQMGPVPLTWGSLVCSSPPSHLTKVCHCPSSALSTPVVLPAPKKEATSPQSQTGPAYSPWGTVLSCSLKSWRRQCLASLCSCFWLSPLAIIGLCFYTNPPEAWFIHVTIYHVT